MDKFLLENKAFFVEQVNAFEAQPSKAKAPSNSSSASDTLIGARIRPLLPKEQDAGQISAVSAKATEGNAAVHEIRAKVNGKPAINSFSFQLDKIYGPDAATESVYHDLVEPLVPWALGGGISTLFAYGQTGSGKTYTVNELEKLAAGQLMNGGLDDNRDIFLCMFELAGNAAFDLLNDRRKISVMEDSFGECQLVGAVEHKPSNAEELLELIERGMSFRKSAPTLKNDASSRSHAVCRLRIVNQDSVGVPDGLLFLIDLAGSEAASDSKDHTQDRMKETRDINLSLSTLKDCIRGRALWSVNDGGAVGNKKIRGVHIPYRSSVLTKVLKHVFDVQGDRSCKTAVLACVTPCANDCGPTKNTFRYAELLRIPVPRLKPVAFKAGVPSTWSNKDLKEWIDKNSGNPPVSSSLLAPTETGMQLCKLPKGEFVSRCVRNPGTTAEQGRLVYDKLWRLHIDSRKAKADENQSQKESQTEHEQEQQAAPLVPFQTRLRPGMFIRLNNRYANSTERVVMIMSQDVWSEKLGLRVPQNTAPEDRWLCAEVNRGLVPDSYVLSVTRQYVYGLEEMAEEMLLEYDTASRYYFVNI